jgi:putative hemolysin
LVQGDAMVHTIARELGVDLPEGDFATIAGLCLHLAGHIPAQGAVLDTGTGVTLEVVEATLRRIKRVRLQRV